MSSLNAHSISHAWAAGRESAKCGNYWIQKEWCNGLPTIGHYSTWMGVRVGAGLFILNGSTYSSSTNKFQGRVRGATSGQVITVRSGGRMGQSSPLGNADYHRYLCEELKDLIQDYGKCTTRAFRRKANLFSEIQANLKAFEDMRRDWIPVGIRFTDEHKTPEIGAKFLLDQQGAIADLVAADEDRKRKQAEAARAEAEARSAEIQELIPHWRGGDNCNISDCIPTLLRIKGDNIETSRYAKIPLREAVILYRRWKAGKPILGHTVGDFTVTSISNDFVKIGCHQINLSEIENVLGPASENQQLAEDYEQTSTN